MAVNIAIFGHSHLLNYLSSYKSNDYEIEITLFKYDELSEIIPLIDCAYTYDIYIFLESLPYLYVKDYLDEKHLPILQTWFDTYIVLGPHYKLKYITEQTLNCLNDVLTEYNINNNNMSSIKPAQQLLELSEQKFTQFVVGAIYIRDDQLAGDSKKVQIERLHELLIQFSKQTYTSIFTTIDNQFILLGTKKLLDYITAHFGNFPLLNEITYLLNTEVDIGFGFGLTTKQAEDNANLALEVCFKSESGSCYVLNDQREIFGPLGIEKRFDTSQLYKALIHKAHLNNHVAYNFIEFISNRNNEPFSSNDVASFYCVTKRSAERTVNKLLTNDVIKIIGEERPYIKGRPRKLFQINI